MIDQLSRIRRLTIILFFSISLNVLFCMFIVYGFLKEKPFTPYIESMPVEHMKGTLSLAMDTSNADMIRSFKKLSFEQLVGKLSSQRQVENGYAERDLALACLVAFHHFDLLRALGVAVEGIQERRIIYGKTKGGKMVEVTAFPGLTDTQYGNIFQFAKVEKWPLTAKGIFFHLQKKQEEDASLKEAFYLTQEFISVETLFSRSEDKPSRQELLNLLLEGNWSLLFSFAEQQRRLQDLSSARRQQFLLGYIESHSQAAAYLFLRTDPDFASKKLDDHHALTVLKLLDHPQGGAKKFALALLQNPRTDAVWAAAAKRLYEYSGESEPENFEYQAVLTKFLQNSLPAKTQASPLVISRPESIAMKKKTETKQDRLYVVQIGDSLWKISRRFHVDLELIKKINGLESDRLQPGDTLRLP